MVIDCPPTTIEFKVTDNAPAPLNLPGDLASTTVPLTPAPEAIATSPSTETGWASVPVKVSPLFAVLVSMVLPMRTTRLVPAGTVIGGGGGGGAGVDFAICFSGAGVICCCCCFCCCCAG